MTEEMKQALDKAARNLQWSSGSMLIDKETLQPADPAVVPLERLVHLPVPNLVDTAVHFGANWYRNNIWHEKTEKPKDDSEVLLYFGRDRNKVAWMRYYDCRHCNNYLKVAESWAYVEDILPTKGYKETDK